MVIAKGNDVRAAINQVLLEALVKFREFRPVDPGMVMMLGVKTNIEHSEIEQIRYEYGGVAYRFGGSLRDTSRMLDIHP